MPSFEIQADIFTRLSVFDSPKGSSNTFKTHKNISLYFKRRYLIIYNYFYFSAYFELERTSESRVSSHSIPTEIRPRNHSFERSFFVARVRSNFVC